MQRIPALDYLRGLMALSVLLFHFNKWTSGVWQADSLLGRLGVYAVAVFFVLSGLTLGVVYQNSLILAQKPLKKFFIKRFLRIYPLMWLVTICTILLDHWTDFYLIFLNFTGLFAFLKPSGDIALGVWSIGNELVFYCFFPLVLWLANHKNPLWFAVFLGLLYVIAGYFAFAFLDNNQTIQEQWQLYVHPLNNAFFFFSGLGFVLLDKSFPFIKKQFTSKISVALLLVLTVSFVLYPIDNQPIALITDWNRVIFSLLIIAFCGVLFFSNLRFSGFLHRALTWLGDVSYSIYLVHPLVFQVLKGLNARYIFADLWMVALLAIPVTFLVGNFVYQEYEKRWMRLGKL
jgi:exopolysaccharide production protein ExoZ